MAMSTPQKLQQLVTFTVDNEKDVYFENPVATALSMASRSTRDVTESYAECNGSIEW